MTTRHAPVKPPGVFCEEMICECLEFQEESNE